MSPAGSHKPNTAVAQAFYNREEGVKRLATETGAGQWGTSLAIAGALFGLEVKVYMVRASYDQKPYRRVLMETYGAEVVASPSLATDYLLGLDPTVAWTIGFEITSFTVNGSIITVVVQLKNGADPLDIRARRMGCAVADVDESGKCFGQKFVAALDAVVLTRAPRVDRVEHERRGRSEIGAEAERDHLRLGEVAPGEDDARLGVSLDVDEPSGSPVPAEDSVVRLGTRSDDVDDREEHRQDQRGQQVRGRERAERDREPAKRQPRSDHQREDVGPDRLAGHRQHEAGVVAAGQLSSRRRPAAG